MLEVVLVGPGPVVARHIGTRPLYVGRADSNDLVLADETVSSRHLGLWVVGTQVMVEDLKSRNGTFIGKHRVRGVEPVPSGAIIRVGLSTELRIEGGRLDLGSLQAPGYGYSCDVTWDERTPLDLWTPPTT